MNQWEYKQMNVNQVLIKVYELKRISLFVRDTSWESRFCQWHLSHPHTWHWTSQCSVFMLNTDSLASQWRQLKRPCPCANPQRGRRFTTTLHEVCAGELYDFFPNAVVSKAQIFVSSSDLRGWLPVSSTQTISLHHVGGQWPQPRQVVPFYEP